MVEEGAAILYGVTREAILDTAILAQRPEVSSGLRYEKSFQKKLQLHLDPHRYLLSCDRDRKKASGKGGGQV